MILTGAQILVKELIRHNVKNVFGYPGGAVLNIYDELYKNSSQINHIITAHEQGAVHAADGYARVTGDVGVVIATSGPGATNLVTGIANAYLDSIPLVAFTGNVSSDLVGKDSFQEVDIVGITLPVVKHNYIVKNVKDLKKVIQEAFYIAKEGRPGPVLVDIPKDIQIGKCEYSECETKFEDKQENIDTNVITHAVETINESKKPYIYCGGGVVIANASQKVIELSTKIDAPIGLSMMGVSSIPSSYDLNLGMTGMHGKYSALKAKAESDLIIAIGVRFSDRATGNKKEYIGNRKIIHIDIDPTEFDKNIKGNIKICGDVNTVLDALINKVSKRENNDWHKQINSFRKTENEIIKNSREFSPKNIVETVNKYCDENTVIATDVGQHQLWTIQNYKFEKPRTLLTSGGLGTMGYGLGAAIGGCIGSNKNRTILFTGDGSFGMNLNELATAVSQDIPLVIIIMNNGTLGMVRQWQKVFYDERYSQTTLNRKTDFVMLSKAFGANGYNVTNLEELNEALKNAFKNSSPVVIDCHIDIDEKVLPMIPPGGSIKNMIIN